MAIPKRFAATTKRIIELEAENSLLRSELATYKQSKAEFIAPHNPIIANKEINREYRRVIEEDLRRSGNMPNVCKICKVLNRSLVFDHCHKTGLYRGHPCSRCNLMLGLANDDQERLYRAGRYLREFEVKQSRIFKFTVSAGSNKLDALSPTMR